MFPFELTKDTPYLALSGELWSVFYEYFNRNWSCYKGFLLYQLMLTIMFCYLPHLEEINKYIAQHKPVVPPMYYQSCTDQFNFKTEMFWDC